LQPETRANLREGEQLPDLLFQGVNMSIDDKICVSSDLDVVTARMKARKMAKQMGFGTADQARISLAASELARALSWNNDAPGEIIFSETHQNGQQGLQVACLVKQEYVSTDDQAKSSQPSVPTRCVAGACQLLDESIVEARDDQKAQIILIKWLNLD
jgi:serine/threonine-protein kinase RsbT